jgi:hypothetical protein
MKKTLIALAAVASMSASYAQVNITGGVDFTYQKNADASVGGSGAKGIANTDAYIDVSVSEDLGGGTKATVFMEFNADGEWGAANYAGDKSINLTGPNGTVVVTSTRSGGILTGIMLAPIVSADDNWSGVNAGVMARGKVDALVYLLPKMGDVTLGYKYVEGVSSGGGYATPSNATHVLYGKYASGPLTAVVEYNIRNSADLVGDVRGQRLDAVATYDAGVAKVALGIETGYLGTANSSSTGTAATATLLSASIPVGSNSVGFNYGKRDSASFAAFGAQYNFSKTTYLGASVGTFTSQSGASSDTFGVRLGKNF